MRILHLNGDFEDAGGVFSVIRNLKSASEQAGWEHVSWVNTQYVELRKPALVYRTSKHVCSDLPNHFQIFVRSFRAFFDLRKLLQAEHFDLVHSHSRGTVLCGLGTARFLRRPVIFTNHTYANRIGLYQWIASQPGMHTVLLTPAMSKYYKIDENPPKVSIISECCADSFFSECLPNKSLPKSDPIKLIGIGNVMRWKNWHLLVRALSFLSSGEREKIDFSLWGPTTIDADSQAYHKELLQLIGESRLEKQVRLCGFVQNVRQHVRQADWFVLPSTNEPCSVALIEAMALGVPVLVSASGGNVDIVKDGKTGLLFKPDDPEDLAAKLRIIINQQYSIATPDEIRNSVSYRSATFVWNQYAKLYGAIAQSKSTIRFPDAYTSK